MTQYSNRERILAQKLARLPQVKRLLKVCYESAAYLRHRHHTPAVYSGELREFGAYGSESFFGYYDKCPVSPDGTLLLWHESDRPSSTPPDPNQPIAIVVADSSGCERTRLQSYAYNWQQGSRLQWLDCHRFAFNDYEGTDGCYIARIFDREGRPVRTLSRGIADAHGPSGLALSVDFRRLAACEPDYGYFNLPPFPLGEIQPAPSDEGLWIMDLDGGSPTLVVSLDELASGLPSNTPHWINHPLISPDGEQCIFLHRSRLRGARVDRLMRLSLRRGRVREIASTGMVSHMAWINEGELLGYLRGPDGRTAYWLVDVQQGRFVRSIADELQRFGDGHPSVSGDWVVTDSYPDKARLQHLLAFNWKLGQVRHLGAFFHGRRFREARRCDLHPRLDPDGSRVYFDSVWTGQRRLYCLEFGQCA